MNAHKKAVLKRHPNAFCRMSQLSDMFFVYNSRIKNRRRALAYQSHPATAWKSAHLDPLEP